MVWGRRLEEEFRGGRVLWKDSLAIWRRVVGTVVRGERIVAEPITPLGPDVQLYHGLERCMSREVKGDQVRWISDRVERCGA